MKLILKNTQGLGLPDLIIEEFPHTLGRQGLPSPGPGEASAQLQAALIRVSRAHAQLTLDQGRVFLADLGSTNGTTVNGEPLLDKPRALRNSDVVVLGEALSFSVGLEDAQAPTVMIADAGQATLFIQEPGLTLTPDPAQPGLGPLHISLFPRVIGRSEPPFSTSVDLPAALRNSLSRQHAEIQRSGKGFQVRDLGSTNGTFVDGRRLDDKPHPLGHGACLALGGQLRYAVAWDNPPAGQPPREETPPPVDLPPPSAGGEAGARSEQPASHTVFPGHATQFLDIILHPADKPAQEAQAREGGVAAGPAAPSTPSAGPATPSPKAAAKGKALWGAALALALVLGLAALWLGLTKSPQARIKEMLAKGDYAQAAVLAQQALKEEPANEALGELALRTLVMGSLPAWSAAMNAGNMAGADEVLQRSRQGWPASLDGCFAALQLIQDVNQFTLSRPDKTLFIYQDEKIIESLLGRWREREREHSVILGRIGKIEPGFTGQTERLFTNLNTLRHHQSTHLPAIAELSGSLDKELAAGNPAQMQQSLAAFARKYPKIQGLDQLAKDLGHYQLLLQAVKARDLAAMLDLSQEGRFTSPPVRKQAKAVLEVNLPPPPFLDAYNQAMGLWRTGRAQEAARAMAGLEKDPAWGALAAAKARHFRKVQAAHAAWAVERSPERKGEALLALWGSLDLGEDVHYAQELAREFQAVAVRERERAERLVARAGEEFKAYQAAGGISGFMRMETDLSPLFRKRAGELGRAHESLLKAAAVYAAINQDMPHDSFQLKRRVGEEVRAQRSRLTELEGILGKEMLAGKLALLPRPGEEN